MPWSGLYAGASEQEQAHLLQRILQGATRSRLGEELKAGHSCEFHRVTMLMYQNYLENKIISHQLWLPSSCAKKPQQRLCRCVWRVGTATTPLKKKASHNEIKRAQTQERTVRKKKTLPTESKIRLEELAWGTRNAIQCNEKKCSPRGNALSPERDKAGTVSWWQAHRR